MSILLSQYSLAHAGVTIVFGVVFVTTRLTSLPISVLRWVDAVTLVIAGLLFAVIGAGMAQAHMSAGGDPMQALLIAQLACGSTMLTRAVAVPSTPERTFWIGLVALVPQVAYSAYILVHAPVLSLLPGYTTRTQMALGNLWNIVAWSGLALTISTVASSVIFGLRAETNKVKRLGQYTLEEKIGEGGMGIVYRARHALLRRPTAIKLLSPKIAGDDNVRRFEREVQLTATLTHPNTVAIYDYGRTPSGVFYYAMEYLDGLNLEELVKDDGAQLPGRVIHILTQVSGALTEAHEAGVIHRDIKPANIILCKRGSLPDVAKVVDFGLVKPVVTPSEGERVIAMTAQNVILGTPLYMAPEVIRGEATVDGRSDLYALGAVAYYLLTGTPLFESSNVMELLAAHLHTAPKRPGERTARLVPADLEEVILRCLLKDPDDRFASARELTAALDSCGHSTPWSLEAADAWWDAFNGRHTRDAVDARSRKSLPTLAIDIDAR